MGGKPNVFETPAGKPIEALEADQSSEISQDRKLSRGKYGINMGTTEARDLFFCLFGGAKKQPQRCRLKETEMQ